MGGGPLQRGRRGGKRRRHVSLVGETHAKETSIDALGSGVLPVVDVEVSGGTSTTVTVERDAVASTLVAADKGDVAEGSRRRQTAAVGSDG
jgi:hypothetical protein